MDVCAAVAFAPGKPLEVTTVQLDGPRAGEVLLEIKATGVCHTDEFTLSGADPEGLFPSILGHEGAGVVVEAGAGVTSVKKVTASSPFTRPNAAIARPACHARPICAPPSAQPRAKCLTGRRDFQSVVRKFTITFGASFDLCGIDFRLWPF